MDVLIDGMHSLPVGAKPFKDPEAGSLGGIQAPRGREYQSGAQGRSSPRGVEGPVNGLKRCEGQPGSGWRGWKCGVRG